jgi:hypothetical protein
VIDPATGAPIAEVAEGGAADRPRGGAARTAFDTLARAAAGGARTPAAALPT